MIEIGKVRRLTVRHIRPGNPEWVNAALRARVEEEISPASQQTSFGRHWQVMQAVREKCLPQLAAARVPVRALVIGVGGEPYPEVFEVKDMLMKAGVPHQLSVMDIRRETLLGDREIEGMDHVFLGIQDIARIRLNPDELKRNNVPPEYYHTFLGKETTKTDDAAQIIEVSEEVRKGIELFQGDIITSQLPPQRFDLVFCFFVLEHYSGLLRQLGVLNIASGLRSGGSLIMEGVTDYGLNGIFKNIDLEDWFSRERLAELGFKKEEPPFAGSYYRGQIAFGHFALQKI